jgi:chromate transporter
MHEELVVRRRWISEKRYLHALNYCMLLPGPEAQQLATYTGWLMHGTRGGLAAGALFVLPSLVLLVLLSWAYTAWGSHPWGQALLWGLKPAVTALVLHAAFRLGLRTLKKRWLWGVAALSLLGMLWGLPFPWIILGAAAAGFYMTRTDVPLSPTPAPLSAQANEPPQAAPHTDPDSRLTWLSDETPQPAHTRFSLPRLLRALGLGLGLWALSLGMLALLLGLGHSLTQMGGFFTKAALFTFGGAYAVLP